jgi:hypothetical protein
MTWHTPPAASGRTVVRGQRVVFTDADFMQDPTSAIVQVAQPRTIIDLQFPEPGTWALTLTPPAYDLNPQIWPLGADEQLLDTQMFSSLPNLRLRYRLRWGAGGTSIETVGTWPQMGQTITLSTDTLRLEVIPQFNLIL